jgi:hypothetical protein
MEINTEPAIAATTKATKRRFEKEKQPLLDTLTFSFEGSEGIDVISFIKNKLIRNNNNVNLRTILILC